MLSANADGPSDHLSASSAAEPPRLNWKGRILESFQSLVSWCLFPDLRAEWARPAREALHQLLDELKPDVVVSSHEPATTLRLGLEAKRRGFRWVADLGDPVLAAYTPARWRRTAAILESTVMREADHVLVTAEQARELLERRHACSTPVTVVTQGFEEGFVPARPCARALDGPLELLYGGSFYSFRDPRALVEAVLTVPGVRLHVASGSVPAWLAKIARNNSAQVRLLGRVPHQRLLALQCQVDVLINIANRESSQVPGKFYEYLGAGRPVLHLLAGQEMDATGALLHRLRRGRTCAASRGAIAAELAYLLEARARGVLDQGFDLGPEAVRAWSWTASAARAQAALTQAAAG
ncbi:glycosyltransferase [Lysobacter zhanggongensis]